MARFTPTRMTYGLHAICVLRTSLIPFLLLDPRRIRAKEARTMPNSRRAAVTKAEPRKINISLEWFTSAELYTIRVFVLAKLLVAVGELLLRSVGR